MADPQDVKVLFGLRVRQLRRERGISQEAFAHRVGLNRSYFGSVERGERNVSIENIAKIADGLGVPPFELLKFDGSESADRGTSPHKSTDHRGPPGDAR